MKRIVVAILMVFVSNTVLAVEQSIKGKVTGYFTGWAKDQVRVTIEGATYVEGNCTNKDGYVTVESDNTGYKTHTTALLSAYMSEKPVTIVVEGCVSGRPRIWGVSIY